MSELLSEISHQLNHYLPQKAITGFAALGLAYAAKKGYDAIAGSANMLYKMAPVGTSDLAERYGRGSWVLVTGATSGIGREYVHCFARRGFNIIIVSRNPAKVVTFSEEVKALHKVDVRPVIADFTKATEPEFFDKIYKQVEGLDVSVIVNNVGAGAKEMFHLMEQKKMTEMDMVNLLPMVMISRHYINHLISRKKKSAIINLSSVAAKNMTPKNSIYSASKAFVDHFSENMFLEYKDKVDVLSVRPQYVWTKMLKGPGAKPNPLVVTPDKTAEESLRWLGSHRYFTYGARWHELVGHLHENSTLFYHFAGFLRSKYE